MFDGAISGEPSHTINGLKQRERRFYPWVWEDQVFNSQGLFSQEAFSWMLYSPLGGVRAVHET